MKKIFNLIILAICLFVFIGCDSDMSDDLDPSNYAPSMPSEEQTSGDSYKEIIENQFIKTTENALSTFSLDNSTAGYANLRRMITNNQQIPKNSVKIEEMVNYFKYDYPAPTGDDALKINSEIMTCPWNANNKIVSIGVKAKDIDKSEIRNNIVFLLDVSGSMDDPKKLGLMKEAFILFTETLHDDDTVSIVTYASGVGVRLEGAKGSEKLRIVNIIQDLKAGGSTAGASGIQSAYNLASKYFITNGNNRVIIGTDGDFNVGISSASALEDFISEKRNTGVYLSVLGFGYGNLQDNKLETLANKGNGNYAYIDSINEAKKVLVEEIGGTLNTVSKDTKVQVTFNPKYVKEYRLLGYENKLLTNDQFNDENTDAGEIGAGHVATAVYELVLNTDDTVDSTLGENNWLKVHIKYKEPQTSENKEIITFTTSANEKAVPSEDILFISGVVELGLILRESTYKSDASITSIIQRITPLTSVQQDEYKAEFLELVKKLQ